MSIKSFGSPSTMGNIIDYPPKYNPNDYVNNTNLILNPANYKNYGLYHTLNHLKGINIKDIANANINIQIDYADAITRRYAKNPIFINTQIGLFPTTVQGGELNVTSIGNIEG